MAFYLRFLALLLASSIAAPGLADTVILSAGDDRPGSVEITGEIVDYTGEQIIVRRDALGDRDYPAARVRRIDTTWPEGYEAGTAALVSGEYARAADRLAAAARADQRPWVRRLAMEHLMQCYAATGDLATAGRLLVELARSDPTTPAVQYAPLAWHASDNVPPATADGWLSSELDAAQLLGASFTLAGSGRSDAERRLQALMKSTDERIARLAEMQTWRVKIVTAAADDLSRWEGRLRDLPESLQPGGWLVLGDAHRHRRDFDAAALAYLRCSMLASRQPHLASHALWQASRVLATAGEQDEAARLGEQLVSGYRETAAARRARSVLQSP